MERKRNFFGRWESDFNLLHDPLAEWNNSKIWETMKICQYCTEQRAITTLLLNACGNQM